MKESKNGLWSESCYVYWHDTDLNGNMSFTAIARYLQEAAWHSAENLGFGYKRAMELGQFWVVVRQHIKIYKFPRWAEQITIETWPRGIDGLWAFRDYYLKDGSGNILGGIASSWMIIDANKRRPQKPEIVFDALPYTLNKRAIEDDAPKITWDGPSEPIDERIVRFSDMDHNGHVNNSKFIEWIFDALRLNGNKKQYKEFMINYLLEVKEKEHVRIYAFMNEREMLVKGERRDDGRGVFIAKLK